MVFDTCTVTSLLKSVTIYLMYKQLTKQDLQRILKVPETYAVEGLFVIGTHPKSQEYPLLYEVLDKLGIPYQEEKIENGFFGDIKSFVINGKRIWFDVVYGTAYLSEVIHIASKLGSKANILLGTCGSLKEDLNSGDTVIPITSYGNESSTRMYQPENSTFTYESNKDLRDKIKKILSHRKVIDEGNLMTVQAMLAETKGDVDKWASENYSAVDMESATVFAVSNHFNVPSAALLYVADNLVKNQLTTDDEFKLLKTQRIAIRKENYEITLKVLLQ